MKYIKNIGWGIVHVHTHDYRDIWLNPGHRIPLNIQNREQLAYYKPYLSLDCVIEEEADATPIQEVRFSERHLTVPDDIEFKIKESTSLTMLKDNVVAHQSEEVTDELDVEDIQGHYGDEVLRVSLESKSKVEIMKELKDRQIKFKTSQTKQELVELLITELGGGKDGY